MPAHTPTATVYGLGRFGSDARRLRDKFIAAGTITDYRYIMAECRKVVYADQKGGRGGPTPVNKIAAAALNLDFGALSSVTARCR